MNLREMCSFSGVLWKRFYIKRVDLWFSEGSVPSHQSVLKSRLHWGGATARHNGHANLPHIYIPSVCKSTTYLYCRCERHAGQVFGFISGSPSPKNRHKRTSLPCEFLSKASPFWEFIHFCESVGFLESRRGIVGTPGGGGTPERRR